MRRSTRHILEFQSARSFARHVLRLVILLVCAVADGQVQAQVVQGCGSLDNAYGPFDYRERTSTRQKELELVERFHFSAEVESLRIGKSQRNPIGDLDYTLRAFPNHYRALNTISKYQLRGGRYWPNPSVQSADCYFRRAIAFAAQDGVTHMLYGNYLAKKGDVDGAHTQYDEALKINPTDAELNYNVGLFFLNRGDLERAKQYAKVAYDGGYPLKGLQKMIEAAESK